MFERFTREARDCVIQAQALAHELASPKIGSRHLLFALMTEPSSAAAALRAAGVNTVALAAELRADLGGEGLDREALASLGIDLGVVSQRADELFGARALHRARTRPKQLPFTQEAKKILKLALRETVRLKHHTISSIHLALGVLRANGPAHAALAAHAEPTALRRALEAHAAQAA